MADDKVFWAGRFRDSPELQQRYVDRLYSLVYDGIVPQVLNWDTTYDFEVFSLSGQSSTSHESIVFKLPNFPHFTSELVIATDIVLGKLVD
jgi:hypothetical protein